MPDKRFGKLLLVLLMLFLMDSAALAQPGRQFGPAQNQPVNDQGAIGFVCCLYSIGPLIAFAMAIWVFNDAGNYGMNQFGWALLAFFFGLIGLAVYLIVRSNANNARPRRRRRPRPRPRADDDDEDDRPRRRRRPDDDDDNDRPRGGYRMKDDDDNIRRRKDWERDADY